MNGLWRLIRNPDDTYDFAIRDNGRPLNFLAVGENGDGAFLPSYPGGEHVEFPSNIPEANDNPSCVERDWCNQYAHEEASDVINERIPWWSACNEGTVTWATQFEPIEFDWDGQTLRMVWEAPLVKEADGDGTWDGDECHADWLFPDGIRRPVYLQAGYEFSSEAMHFDRVLRFRNPEGNPEFTGPMSVIGGFVLTRWPDPHPMKEVHRWMRPATRGFVESQTGISIEADAWNHYTPLLSDDDMVLAWLDQPFTFSAFPDNVPGQTATLSHVGESDNADVGVCLCTVHGAVEMGGGLLHGGTSLPLTGGELSIEARRRFELPGTLNYPQTRTFDPVNELSHSFGSSNDNGWSANTAEHSPGYLLFGPYTTEWGGFLVSVAFDLELDNVDADNGRVVTIDINDATADEIIATRIIRRSEFNQPFQLQTFSVEADLRDRPGHIFEARVYWHDISYVRVDALTATLRTQ